MNQAVENLRSPHIIFGLAPQREYGAVGSTPDGVGAYLCMLLNPKSSYLE